MLVQKRLLVFVVFLTVSDLVGCVTVSGDGGYEDLVVVFSPTLVGSGNALDAVRGFKDILERASSSLHELTRHHLHLSKVTFLVPRSLQDDWWPSDDYPPSDPPAPYVRTDRADVIVVRDGDMYRGRPYAVQHGGCGQEGRVVYMGVNGVKVAGSELQRVARFFAFEWMRYRFGVFPEHGFSLDPLYPDFYQVVGPPDSTSLEYNSCAHPSLKVVKRDLQTDSSCEVSMSEESGLPNENRCVLRPDRSQNQNVLSSFMSLPQLAMVKDVCDSGTHDAQKPTKQNVLCNGNSVWTIMNRHSDFSGNAYPHANLVPEISVVFQENLEISIIYGIGKEYGLNKIKKILDSMLFRFIQCIPDKSKVKVLPYPKRAHQTFSLVDDLKALENFIRGQSINSDEQSNVGEAVGIYLDQMNPRQGSLAILVTNGAFKDKAQLERYKDRLHTLDIRLHLILHPFNQNMDPATSVVLQDLVQGTGGSIWTVPVQYPNDEEDGILTQLQLGRAFASGLGGYTAGSCFTKTIARKVIHVNEVKATDKVNVDFYLQEKSVASVTAIVYENALDSGKHSIDNQNVFLLMVGPKHQLTIDDKLPSRFYVTVEEEDQISSGNLSFIFTRKPDYPIVVEILIVPREDKEHLNINAWWSKIQNVTVPVIIYAYLEFGVKPVRGATVWATITRPDNVVIELPLLDNGLGDPDVTKDDGIYSRYFTNFGTMSGYYYVTITAVNNQTKARVVQTLKYNDEGGLCCGSFLPTEKVEDIYPFKMLQDVGSFYVRDIGRSDIHPPGRICDLRVRNYTKWSRTIDLVWTAPGSSYDMGKVQSYNLKSFDNYTKALENFDTEGESITESTIQPDEYGTIQNILINLKTSQTGEYVYYAIKATNNGKRGTVSNIVAVYVASATSTSSGKGGFLSSEEKNIIIGVSAGILVILLIVTIIICVVVVRTRRKTDNSSSSNNSNNINNVHSSRNVIVTSRETDEPELVPSRPAPIRPLTVQGGNLNRAFNSYEPRQPNNLLVNESSEDSFEYTTPVEPQYGRIYNQQRRETGMNPQRNRDDIEDDIGPGYSVPERVQPQQQRMQVQPIMSVKDLRNRIPQDFKRNSVYDGYDEESDTLSDETRVATDQQVFLDIPRRQESRV